MKWRVVLEPDPETQEWAIWCPELPGCVSAGSTEAEALENIKEAIELYLAPDSIELAESSIIREVFV
ncbi:MAG: type II toxin-antitoxin system HicB family antitoxin [Elainella sp.]